MKQKYSLYKNDESKRLVIQEYAELDKEILSLLCEETYDEATVKNAIGRGSEALVEALRTRNMYPPSAFAKKIADAVVELYEAAGEQSMDIFFDDKEFFETETLVKEEEEELDAESDDLDDLLEDEDIDDVYEDKKMIKDLKSSLKVADDETPDTDEEP